ncbi:MAG TPA: allophanate hydrolase subunit 1 [Candidatus Eremiobacteraceae bacterium]|nr:allophanate hydrolase subunit 1 [Candidatus Eremiobacteraceae bacterium]
MQSFACRSLGDASISVELGTSRDPELALQAARLADSLSAWLGSRSLDVVSGYCSVLIRFDPLVIGPAEQLRAVTDALAACAAELETGSAREQRPPRNHTVRVCFGGEHGVDFERTAHDLGMRETRMRDMLCGADYRVAFLGFLAGFPYLSGLPPALHGVERLTRPRPRVPAGSVAIAAGQCGIYPRASAGGWRLLGRTNAVLFEPAHEPPTLFQPLDRIRFEPVSDLRSAGVTTA